MCESKLRHFRRHSAIIIHEGNNAGVQGPLCGLVHATDRLGVSLVLLANASGGAGSGSHPSKTESATGEIPVTIQTNGLKLHTTHPDHITISILQTGQHLPIGEHVGQTKILVIAQRMQIQKVAHVDVLHAEGILVAVILWMGTGSVVINLKTNLQKLIQLFLIYINYQITFFSLKMYHFSR